MKLFFTTLILSLFLTNNAKEKPFKHYIPNVKAIKTIEGTKMPYLLAAETEVSNLQYKEFLWDLKKGGKIEEYKKNILDSNLWVEKLKYNYEPYKNFYYSHPAFYEYPVVTITQQQAKNYCQWLTKTLNEKLKNSKSPYKTIIVRLPTEAEWEYAALGGLEKHNIFPWGSQSLYYNKNAKYVDHKKINGYGLANFKTGFMSSGDITATTLSYWANGYGLYNMSGNVAEMVQEKGISKGGGWNSTGLYLKIQATEKTPKANPNTGFRYFVEVVEFKKSNKKPLELTAKMIEQSMANIPNTKNYMFKTELSNEMYALFINDIPKIEAKKHTIKHSNWAKHSNYKYLKQYGQSEAYNNYPVVNVSYEAANAYCKWLTNKYMGFKKRKHKSIKYRLPTQTEWEIAAKGARAKTGYTYGDAIKNRQHKYLYNYSPQESSIQKVDTNNTYYCEYENGTKVYCEGNFLNDLNDLNMKVPFKYLEYNKYNGIYYLFPNGLINKNRAADGHTFIANTTAYFPNTWNIYNGLGNVAEMVQKKGISKGGSWNSTFYYLHFKAYEKYTKANCMTGFRVYAVVE